MNEDSFLFGLIIGITISAFLILIIVVLNELPLKDITLTLFTYIIGELFFILGYFGGNK